jgi:hypothetical protein
MDVNGTWREVSSPDFGDDYLGVRAHVTLRQNGKFVKGKFAIGAQYGTINGAVYDEFMDFDFEREDEGEHRFGEFGLSSRSAHVSVGSHTESVWAIMLSVGGHTMRPARHSRFRGNPRVA